MYIKDKDETDAVLYRPGLEKACLVLFHRCHEEERKCLNWKVDKKVELAESKDECTIEITV